MKRSKPKKSEKDIIIYVMNIPEGAVEGVKTLSTILGRKIHIMYLVDSRVKKEEDMKPKEGIDFVVSCDFSKQAKLAEVLLPYQHRFLAITCRSEQSMARFAEVIPQVPYLRTPHTESLRWASDKYEMRKRMKVYNPKITPKFTLVKENTKVERERIIEKIGFPMIVKPANLAASLFVSICYHEEDLDQTLRNIFRKIPQAYKNDKRLEVPKVIAEEYMDGDMYSIDSYVDSRGRAYHCPLVKVVTGKKIGRDDFYNYLQMTPTIFKSATVEKAHRAAEDAIHALGLASTTTHTELMKIDDEWKVIEIGARVGGFRHVLHSLSCDINHSLNDVLIRIPKKPVIPKKCQGYACAMKWFAAKEGKILEMKGIKSIEKLESFHNIVVNKKVGDRATFARNGGRSVFNLFLYNLDRSKLLADIRRVEKLVEVKVAPRVAKK